MRTGISSASSVRPGDGPGHFARPKGIAIDSDGHIWVTDEVQSRVQVFDTEGQLLIYLGEHGWYPGQFQGALRNCRGQLQQPDHHQRAVSRAGAGVSLRDGRRSGGRKGAARRGAAKPSRAEARRPEAAEQRMRPAKPRGPRGS